MNSYNKPRNMSNKGMGKRAMPAPKLMAIENNYHRTKDALEHEIKRLRGEVEVLAKRYNNAKREIEDLVKRVRSQPPPPIPKRDEEMERKIEERHERWKKHLHMETAMEEEKEKEKEKDKDIVMPIAMEELEPPIEESNTLSPDQTPLDQSPQSEIKIASEVPSLVSTPPGSHTDENVGMEDEPVKERVTIQAIYQEDDWGAEMVKKSNKQRWTEYKGKARRWKKWCDLMGIEESEMGLEGDLEEASDRMLEIIEEWKEAKEKGKYRGWGKLHLLDGMLYGQKKMRWKVFMTEDGLRFEE